MWSNYGLQLATFSVLFSSHELMLLLWLVHLLFFHLHKTCLSWWSLQYSTLQAVLGWVGRQKFANNSLLHSLSSYCPIMETIVDRPAFETCLHYDVMVERSPSNQALGGVWSQVPCLKMEGGSSCRVLLPTTETATEEMIFGRRPQGCV